MPTLGLDFQNAAFESFQALRRERVDAIVKASRRSGRAPLSAVAAWFRDRMLPLFLKLGAHAQHQAFAYRAELAGTTVNSRGTRRT